MSAPTTISNERTGRFAIKNAEGKIVFETYRLTAEERLMLRLVFSDATDAAFEEGRLVGLSLEKSHVP